MTSWFSRFRQSPLKFRNEIGERDAKSLADRTKLDDVKATLASLVFAHKRLALPEFLRQLYLSDIRRASRFLQ